MILSQHFLEEEQEPVFLKPNLSQANSISGQQQPTFILPQSQMAGMESFSQQARFVNFNSQGSANAEEIQQEVVGFPNGQQ
jgi:hypothetical protein